MHKVSYKVCTKVDEEAIADFLWSMKDEFRFTEHKVIDEIIDLLFEKGGIIAGYQAETVVGMFGYFLGQPSRDYQIRMLDSSISPVWPNRFGGPASLEMGRISWSRHCNHLACGRFAATLRKATLIPIDFMPIWANRLPGKESAGRRLYFVCQFHRRGVS